jgi:hypothetical protein
MWLRLAGSLFWLGVLLGFLEWRYSISSMLDLDLSGSRQIAEDLFGPHVPGMTVLISESFNLTDAPHEYCTVAIVGLSDNARHVPPEMPLMDRETDSFGGDWKEAPETSAVVPASDALTVCAQEIPPRMAEALQAALQRPGAYFIRDWRRKVLQIYSFDDQMAAYIRFGARRTTP